MAGHDIVASFQQNWPDHMDIGYSEWLSLRHTWHWSVHDVPLHRTQDQTTWRDNSGDLLMYIH